MQDELIFEWDEANTGHIARHKVTREEAEQVVLNDPVEVEFRDSEGEERIAVVGMTRRGRGLVVAWTPRGGSVRVVTAFDADPRDMQLYLSLRGA